MFASVRPFVLLLLAVAVTVSACTTGAQKKPKYFDSDTAGKDAKRAEFPGCTPRTETGPILLEGKLPKYPRREHIAEYIGSVDVRFIITENGTTSNIDILRATSRRFSTASSDRFAEEVKTAVAEWIFEPANDQGIPVAVVCAQRHIFDSNGFGSVFVVLLQTRPKAGVDQ